MTQRSDIERVLDLWLGDGPTHVPDGVFDDAVRAVYLAPQRSPWRLRWRDFKVSTRLIAASIAVLAVVAGGLYVVYPNLITSPAASPSSSPTATPTPTATAATSLCQPVDPACLGDLAAGTHFTSAFLTPLRYTVLDGWRKSLDVEGALNLERTELYGPADSMVAVWPDLQVASQTTCSSDPEPGLGRSVTDLVSFVTNHEGLIASYAWDSATTVAGLPGWFVDIRRNPDWSGPCSNAVNLFTHRGTINDDGWIQITGEQEMRLMFLDGPDAHVTTVAIDTPGGWFYPAANSLIESIVFTEKSSCVDDSACTGRLLPGTHETWMPFPHPFQYAVPDGWKNIFNTDQGYVLQPADETRQAGGRGVYVFRDLIAANQASCNRSPEPGVGRTVDDLATWLRGLPDLSVTTPVDVTVGGLSGVSYDVEAASAGPACGSGDYMLWVADAANFWWGTTPGNPERHLVLETPDGGTVFIIVTAKADDFDAFVGAAMPIIETFDFTRAWPERASFQGDA